MAPGHPADELARVLAGHVVGTATGSITIVETRIQLPADLARLRDLPDPIAPERPIVCLDTETTGLGTAAGTVPFLIALGRWQADEFVVRQLLLPDHPDEPALLEILERHIPPDASLVTYNGRAFDWPLITTRFRLHGRPPPVHGAHLDLLPLARQVWRHRLPDARLGSVEAGICGVRRHEDLPGALIPERYFGWLRTGRADLFLEVLEHNRQDVVSLALLLRLLAQEVLPERRWAGVEPGAVDTTRPGRARPALCTAWSSRCSPGLLRPGARAAGHPWRDRDPRAPWRPTAHGHSGGWAGAPRPRARGRRWRSTAAPWHPSPGSPSPSRSSTRHGTRSRHFGRRGGRTRSPSGCASWASRSRTWNVTWRAGCHASCGWLDSTGPPHRPPDRGTPDRGSAGRSSTGRGAAGRGSAGRPFRERRSPRCLQGAIHLGCGGVVDETDAEQAAARGQTQSLDERLGIEVAVPGEDADASQACVASSSR